MRTTESPLYLGVNDYYQGEGDDWWYDLGGHNSYASDYLYATSPYYQWFKEAKLQYAMFAPAQHVGKINREKLLNSERSLPADRAFRDPYHSDFYADELRSGIFEYGPRGQKIYAVVELHEAQGSGVTGTLIVEQNSQGNIRIVGTVHGLEPGTHGFHVHEHGSIGNDCMDAGGHFNPYNVSGPPHKFSFYSFYS